MLSSCQSSSNADHRSFPVFDWQIAAVLPAPGTGAAPGLAGPVAGISGDVLIVGGGSNFAGGAPWNGGVKRYYQDLYVYKKNADSLQLTKSSGRLPQPLAYGASCSTDQGIVVAGGENENGPTASVYLLRWDSTSQSVLVDPLPSLPEPLTAGSMTRIGSTLYFAGGQGAAAVSELLYAFDLNEKTGPWRPVARLPRPTAYGLLLAARDNGHDYLYLIGGRKMNIDSTSDLYSGVSRYDVISGRWDSCAPLPFTVSAHSGVSFQDQYLMIFSGDRGETFHQTETYLMEVAKEKDPAKKQQLTAQKNKLQQAHPGFPNEIYAYDIATDQWIKAGEIPFTPAVTTTAVPWGRDLVLPLGEIRAGVRTDQILIGKVSVPQ